MLLQVVGADSMVPSSYRAAVDPTWVEHVWNADVRVYGVWTDPEDMPEECGVVEVVRARVRIFEICDSEERGTDDCGVCLDGSKLVSFLFSIFLSSSPSIFRLSIACLSLYIVCYAYQRQYSSRPMLSHVVQRQQCELRVCHMCLHIYIWIHVVSISISVSFVEVFSIFLCG